MKTLNAGAVGEASVKKLLILLGKAHAYCIRGCGKWGSPSCFSCMFRDVRQLHREIERGTEDDRKRGGQQADAVQLVRHWLQLASKPRDWDLWVAMAFPKWDAKVYHREREAFMAEASHFLKMEREIEKLFGEPEDD